MILKGMFLAEQRGLARKKALKKEKAGVYSRTRNIVIYGIKYSTD